MAKRQKTRSSRDGKGAGGRGAAALSAEQRLELLDNAIGAILGFGSLEALVGGLKELEEPACSDSDLVEAASATLAIVGATFRAMRQAAEGRP